ncbi:GPI-anchored protein LLG2 isoform X1 [Physcomitrium patens]|uniref:GPI-anchored protein LLG1-like domain-containing protein n=1 Tax=Physcomitrium patens TaxID=3218 RepID=A0A7I4DMG2_PHYPA|nr:GPI-anchored protein LLG2-like isoform X1 [Physcomitrium patens]|eukprot:XP_024372672.1 GPI-anchored protein LLG2-like isoform X1 [Physcomitrella patens]
MDAAKLRCAHLGLLAVVAFLCVASVAGEQGVVGFLGSGESEAGAIFLPGIPSRHLLQTLQPCPVDFANQNYSIVTSVCNATAPDMPKCCSSFTEFACQFASYINDESTNCATAMFSYLNIAGNYQAQLFQGCRGDAQGLPCPLVPEPSPNPSNPNSATMHGPHGLSFVVMFLALIALFW